MASTDILSPRPVDMTPGISLEVSTLDQLCSGTLELLLNDEARASRSAAATPTGSFVCRSPGRTPTPVSDAQVGPL